MRRSVICLAASVSSVLAASAPATESARQDDAYASATQLQQRIAAGSLDSRKLAEESLQRIRRIDQSGPMLKSVIETNPDALSLADKLDQARGSGKHGPLYGLPILLKDNIDTGDRMLTTAGSLALADAPATQDAALVETAARGGRRWSWARPISANGPTCAPTTPAAAGAAAAARPATPMRSIAIPAAPVPAPAAAVAAGLVPLAIGTETDGSIICPASMNGIVGIKPTLGLVSRSGIVPISHSQDTAGPMARNVADAAALLLSVIAGSDPGDPATADADRHATDYTRFLDPQGLQGQAHRRGASAGRCRAECRPRAGPGDRADEGAGRDHRRPRPDTAPGASWASRKSPCCCTTSSTTSGNTWPVGPTLKMKTLADLIAFNKAHADTEMPWFGQELFEQAEAKGPLTDQAYIGCAGKVEATVRP